MTETTTKGKAGAKPSKAAIAHHLFMSVRTVRRLVEEHKLPATGTLDEFREAHILHLREQAAGRAAKAGGLDLVGERAALAKAQRERAQFELARRAGAFCAVDETIRQLKETFYVVKEIALTMPGKASPACAMQPRQIVFDVLQREVNAMLDQMADSAAEEIARRAAEEGNQ